MPRRRARRSPRWTRDAGLPRALVAMSSAAVALVAVGGCSGAMAGAAPRRIAGPSNLAHSLPAIENSPLYQHSDWGISVDDEKSGQVVVGQNDQKMFDPGSTMKIYSISTA